MTGIDVEDFMFALGPNDLWITCPALYWCGTPLETDIGSRFDIELSDGSTATIGYDVNDMELARQLLAESDYAGETAVILNPTGLRDDHASGSGAQVGDGGHRLRGGDAGP